jgi:histidine transport system ATP-binding protein/arginine/ornithine transport system ATP-binding protein
MNILRVDDLHKRYGAVDVLRGVSLVANRGDVVSVIGASGSGKSTLLRCINFLEAPSQGRIALNGEPVVTAPDRHGELQVVDAAQLRQLRVKVAMVFQHFNLWQHLRVVDNVAEAPATVLRLPKAEARERAMACLAKVGMQAFAAAWPSQLSGGQQQRVAIARALAMEPDAILFDEPTSALDRELVGEVLKVMQALAEEGRTMVVVTHEMAFARNVSTQVVFLHQGLVEEQGPPGEVLARPRSARLRQFLS